MSAEEEAVTRQPAGHLPTHQGRSLARVGSVPAASARLRRRAQRRAPWSPPSDDPAHIRRAFVGLAADWRTKAGEARTAARDLTPFAASHTFHAQADLLEMCAAQLEATLNGGKEDAR